MESELSSARLRDEAAREGRSGLAQRVLSPKGDVDAEAEHDPLGELVRVVGGGTSDADSLVSSDARAREGVGPREVGARAR